MVSCELAVLIVDSSGNSSNDSWLASYVELCVRCFSTLH